MNLLSKFQKFFLILILVMVVLVAAWYMLPYFLSVNKPVQSNDLLIESWVSHHEIEKAVKELGPDIDTRFFIVGRKYNFLAPAPVMCNEKGSGPGEPGESGMWLYANSSLGFRVPESLAKEQPDTVMIGVEAKGQEAGGHYAFYNLSVNGECIGGRFTGVDYDTSTFVWVGKGIPFESIYIRFINDLKTPGSDRNLNIRSVWVNGMRISAGSDETCLTREMNNLTAGYPSQADEVAAYLHAIGVPAKNIIPLAFDPPERNLTLAAAVRFREVAEAHDIRSVNVVSSGLHCRRTWVTYRRLLKNTADVGVLNYHPDGFSTGRDYDEQPFFMQLAVESVSYLLNWIQLLIE